MSATPTSSPPVAVRSDSDDRFHVPIVWGITALVVIALWLRPLTSSLWLDELGTWWVIKDGVRETISRAFDVHGQSPAFYLLAFATRHVAGQSEWMLRLPSVFLASLAAFLMFRISTRMIDVEAARIAVLLFVMWPIVAFAATDMRPYALASLAVVASTHLLIRWLDTDGGWAGVLYTLVAASVIYAHYLFALVLLAHICYFVARKRDASSRVGVAHFSAAAAGVVVLAGPLVFQVLALLQRREEWTIPSEPSAGWVVPVLAPASVVAGLLLGGALIVVRGPVLLRPTQIQRPDLILLLAWLVMPVLLLVSVSLLTPIRVMQPRYILVSVPAAAILLSLAVRSVEPVSARRILLLVLAIVSVLEVARIHHLGDWRGAMAAVQESADEDTVVFLQPGFAESDQTSWHADPERRSFLLAPASFYDAPGEMVPLPSTIHGTHDFSRDTVLSEVRGADHALLVASPEVAAWMTATLAPGGWRSRLVSADTWPVVVEYTRRPPD